MKLIESERLYFRWVEEKDITEKYISWMNDKEINQYMETWHYPHSEENIYNYIIEHFEKRDEPFFAIITKSRLHPNEMNNFEGAIFKEHHIGNIKLGPINWIHRYADVSLFIGDKAFWGLGYGTEAIKLIADYGLYTLNLHKICAGIYSCNYVSRKAFEKAGFIFEGQRVNHVNWQGQWMDVLLYGKFKDS